MAAGIHAHLNEQMQCVDMLLKDTRRGRLHWSPNGSPPPHPAATSFVGHAPGASFRVSRLDDRRQSDFIVETNQRGSNMIVINTSELAETLNISTQRDVTAKVANLFQAAERSVQGLPQVDDHGVRVDRERETYDGLG